MSKLSGLRHNLSSFVLLLTMPIRPCSLLVAGFTGLILSAQSARADSLQTWKFTPQQNRLEFTTDEGVQPTAQLVANPTRVVIDLPGIKLGRPRVAQTLSGAVQSVRIGQFDRQTTRLVIELAPGYTLDPQQVKVRGVSPTQWSVQLPTPKFDAATVGAGAGTGPSNEVVINSEGLSAQPRTAAIPVAPLPIMPMPSPTGALTGDTLGGLVPSGQLLSWLQQRVTSLRSSSYASLKPGIVFVDMETGNYIDYNGDKVFATASIIKLPILIALFQEVDAGRIRLDETLVMTRDLIVGGSGEIQDLPVNSKFSLLDTANKMITISDNTATNMIIKRMGGIQVLNQRFRSWGLQKTVMRNWLPDLRGTNTTTAKELVKLLAMLDKQRLLSPSSQAQVIDILRRVKNRKLLVRGLGQGAAIAHKTGDIGFLLGDTGIIEMPTGKHYLAAMLVESGYDDPRAVTFIQDVSRMVYTYLSQPASTAGRSQTDLSN